MSISRTKGLKNYSKVSLKTHTHTHTHTIRSLVPVTATCQFSRDRTKKHLRTASRKSLATQFIKTHHNLDFALIIKFGGNDILLCPGYWQVSRIRVFLWNAKSVICVTNLTVFKSSHQFGLERDKLCKKWLSIIVQQDASIYSFIIFLQRTLHVSGDIFTHHQEHM